MLISVIGFHLYNSAIYLKGHITNSREILSSLSSLETVSKKLYSLYEEEYSNDNTLNSVDLYMISGEVYASYNYSHSNPANENNASKIELTPKEYDSLIQVYVISADFNKFEGIIRASSNGVTFPGGAYYNIYYFFDGSIPEELQAKVEQNEHYKIKRLSIFHPRLFIFMYSYN